MNTNCYYSSLFAFNHCSVTLGNVGVDYIRALEEWTPEPGGYPYHTLQAVISLNLLLKVGVSTLFGVPEVRMSSLCWSPCPLLSFLSLKCYFLCLLPTVVVIVNWNSSLGRKQRNKMTK